MNSTGLLTELQSFLRRRGTDVETLSLNDIGGYFGGRDHTTVLYAIDKIAREAKNNDETGEVLRRLTRSINGR